MKKLMLFIVLCGMVCGTNYAHAIDCATPPTCEELGYTDNVALCPDKYTLCPFDKTKGTCLLEATVGQIGYFPSNKSRKGWLKCDGKLYDKKIYSELADYLEDIFCLTDDGSSNCSEGYFRVPNYQGYFLRVYGGTGQYATHSFNLPQSESLPDVIGNFQTLTTSGYTPNGPIVKRGYATVYLPSSGTAYNLASNRFQASADNSTYKSDAPVLPANYAVQAYIYAGRYGEETGYKVCEIGDAVDVNLKKCYELAEGENRLNIYLGDGYYSVITASYSGGNTLTGLQSQYDMFKTKARTLLSSNDIMNNSVMIQVLYNYARGNQVVVLTDDALLRITGYDEVKKYPKTNASIQTIYNENSYYKIVVLYKEKL